MKCKLLIQNVVNYEVEVEVNNVEEAWLVNLENKELRKVDASDYEIIAVSAEVKEDAIRD